VSYFGVTTCERWSIDRKESSSYARLAQTSWVLGFLSGLNSLKGASNGEVLKNKDPDKLLSQIDSYYQKYPLDNSYDATLDLYFKH